MKKIIYCFFLFLPYFLLKANELDDIEIVFSSENKPNKIMDYFSNNVAVNDLSRTIEGSKRGIDLSLKLKGITNPERRKLWTDKIALSVERCIATAKTTPLKKTCSSPLSISSTLIDNIGLVLVYETIRDNLDASMQENERSNFKKNQIDVYKACISGGKNSKEEIEKCALSIVKNAVVKVTSNKINQIIEEGSSSGTAANTIKTTVANNLNQCIQPIGENTEDKSDPKKQIMECIDNLVPDIGSLLVKDQVANTSSIKSSFSKNEIDTLSKEKSESFINCAKEQKKKDIRINGIIDSNKCKIEVTNEITYQVVERSLSRNASGPFKGNDNLIADLSSKGKNLLNKCWDNKQNEDQKESCIRKTIISFASLVANEKLKKAIPDSFSNKDSMIAPSLDELSECLDKTLPANISRDHNMDAEIGICSAKLTNNTAQNIAHQSVREKANELKVNKAQIDELLKTYVDQKFRICLGDKPNDVKINTCSGELKRNIAMNIASIKLKEGAANKMPPNEIEGLVANFIGTDFSSCIGKNPSDAKLDECVINLKKNATNTIALAVGNSKVKEQLQTTKIPPELKIIQEKLSKCTKGNFSSKNASDKLDECVKSYSLEFAKSLGKIKILTVLNSALGTQDFKLHQKEIDDILNNYNKCLDGLTKYSLADGLLDKLPKCSDNLQNDGVNFVSKTFNDWMSANKKDQFTEMVKTEFSNFLPCLDGLIKTGPSSQSIDNFTESSLKPVAIFIQQFIEYSPGEARNFLKDFKKNLKDTATNLETRKNLLNSVYNNGGLDQFIKSIIYSKLKESLDMIPSSDLSEDIKIALLDKRNFEAIFKGPEGKALKNLVMEKILKPVLMDQEDPKSSGIKLATNAITAQVTKMFVYAPTFGELIINNSIQHTTDHEVTGVTRFFAKSLYGNTSLDWSKVKLTPKGLIAEKYIQDSILLPKFNKQKFSPKEEADKLEKAKELVTEAVKDSEKNSD